MRLRFQAHEIDNIKADPKKLLGAPGSYLADVIDRWTHWAPGDARGSRSHAKLESLKKVINFMGFPDLAATLNLDDDDDDY